MSNKKKIPIAGQTDSSHSLILGLVYLFVYKMENLASALPKTLPAQAGE